MICGGLAGPQWGRVEFLHRTIYRETFLKYSQIPVGQKGCNLCGSILRVNEFKFLQIMMLSEREYIENFFLKNQSANKGILSKGNLT